MNISTSTDAVLATDIARLSAAEMAAGYAAGRLSPVEVAQALLDRIEALDGPVNAIVHLDRETTLAQARGAEARHRRGTARSALDGVPVTIKDLSMVAGWPRRRGSALTGTQPSPEDTPCVARMREAGVVFLAKTATPDGGCKVVTDSAVHGVTRNPWDLSRTPGGSSGGAAAALAMGFGPLALGSDGAGSIRIPASLSNVFGLKPGFGRVPQLPDSDAPHSVVGPMSRSVEDAAMMLAVIAGPEPRDPFGWPVAFAPPDFTRDLTDLRIAISPRLGMTAPLVDTEVDALVAEAGPILAAAGARVAAATPVWPVDPFGPFRIFWIAACMEALRAVPPEMRADMDPIVPETVAAGPEVGLADLQQAIAARQAIAQTAHLFFRDHDLLVGPVMPVPAWSHARATPEGFAATDWSWCPYTYVWNMTGMPAASVPIGFTRDGLPVGVQILGPMGSEGRILRAARAIERARCLHRLLPPTAV